MNHEMLTYLHSTELNEVLAPLIQKKKWKQIREILNTTTIDKDDIDDICDTCIVDMGEFLNDRHHSLYKSSIYLSFTQLAGLINAKEGMFINDNFLAYNCLNYKHTDFIKNFNAYIQNEPTSVIVKILEQNRFAKNIKTKKENFFLLINEHLSHFNEIDELVFISIFKEIDYVKWAMEGQIFNESTLLPTRQINIKCSVLEKAVHLGSTEVVQYLIDSFQWDLRHVREDSTDLVLSAITNEHIHNKDEMLNIILSYIPEYNFHQIYYPDKDANLHYQNLYTEQSKGYNLKEFIEKEKQNLIDDTTHFIDYKEHHLKKYDKILYVIEKYQMEQLLIQDNGEIKDINKTKQKI